MDIPASEPLTAKRCAPCEGGVSRLSAHEATAFLSRVSGWILVNNGERIRKTWIVRNFPAAVAFLNKVAALAEDEGHHPDLHLTGYRQVTIEIWTHAIGGLSENDFILASKIDQLPIDLKQ
jgi:4a-hydroxytetrahydrobiopterin dehydratase